MQHSVWFISIEPMWIFKMKMNVIVLEVNNNATIPPTSNANQYSLPLPMQFPRRKRSRGMYICSSALCTCAFSMEWKSKQIWLSAVSILPPGFGFDRRAILKLSEQREEINTAKTKLNHESSVKIRQVFKYAKTNNTFLHWILHSANSESITKTNEKVTQEIYHHEEKLSS